MSPYRAPVAAVQGSSGIFFGGGGSQLDYGTADQPIVISLGGLASSATGARQSIALDNVAGAVDKIIQGFVTIGVGAPANDFAIYVYAWGNTGGNNFPDSVTGLDAALTLNDPTQLKLIGTINISGGAATFRMNAVSLAAAFGGVLPIKWGLVVRNFCGVAFTASQVDHKFFYQDVVVRGGG